MKTFITSVFLCLLHSALFSQVELEFYAGNNGVSSPKLYKNDKYLFVTTSNFLARSEDGDFFEPLIKNKSGYLSVEGSKLFYLYFKKGFELGLLYSEDNGDNWIEHGLPHNNISASSLNYKKGVLTLVSNSTQYVLHSNDNGAKWDSTYYEDFAYEYPSLENNIYTTNIDKLYKIGIAQKDTTLLDLKPYLKNDYVRQLVIFDELIFIRSFSTILVINKEIDKIVSNTSGNSLYFDVIDNKLYCIKLNDILTFNKNSKEWESILPPNNFSRIYSFMKFKNNSHVAVNNRHIYKIDNANNISISGKRVDRERIYNVKIGEDFIVTQNNNKISIYRPSTDTWENYFESGFSYNYEDIVTNKKQMIAYLDIYNYELRVSVDKGKNWIAKPLPIPSDPFGLPITSYVLKSLDELIVLTNGFDNYISTDYGGTWTLVQQGHDNNIVKFKGVYFGGTFNSTFVSSDLENFTNTSNTYAKSLFNTSDHFIFLVQKNNKDHKLLMSEDGMTWIDVTKNSSWNIGGEGCYFYEKDKYVYALGNYETYRLNLDSKDEGWELIDNSSFLDNLFEFEGNLFSAQSGIYKVFIGESTLSKTSINDMSWITEDGIKIYLSKSARQFEGILYNEVLIDKSNENTLNTGIYITEENGKLTVLKNGEAKILIDYNLALNSEVQISDNKILKLLSKDNVDNFLNLKLNKYNFLLNDKGQTKDFSYTTLIGDKEIFFLSDLLSQYNLNNKVSCIFHKNDLLISNDATCQNILTTEEDNYTFNVFPNPVTDFLNIESNRYGEFNIDIYSSTGNRIFSENINGSNKLLLTNLKKGIYFIKILNNKKEEIFNFKFTKM
jgi:hypothetical protein